MFDFCLVSWLVILCFLLFFTLLVLSSANSRLLNALNFSLVKHTQGKGPEINKSSPAPQNMVRGFEKQENTILSIHKFFSSIAQNFKDFIFRNHKLDEREIIPTFWTVVEICHEILTDSENGIQE